MPRDWTSNRILDEAERLFAEVGFAGARTALIGERAGVTSAMIHYYFKTKEGLYEAVLNRILSEMSEILEGIQPSEMSLEEMLEAFLDGYFDYVARHPSFSKISKMALGTRSRELMEGVVKGFQPLFQAGIDFLEAGIAEGRFLKVDAEQYVVSFYSLLVNYFSDAELLTILLDKDPLAPDMLDRMKVHFKTLFFRGLGATLPSERA